MGKFPQVFLNSHGLLLSVSCFGGIKAAKPAFVLNIVPGQDFPLRAWLAVAYYSVVKVGHRYHFLGGTGDPDFIRLA